MVFLFAGFGFTPSPISSQMCIRILNVFPTEKYRTTSLGMCSTRSSSLYFSVPTKVVSTSSDKCCLLFKCKLHMLSHAHIMKFFANHQNLICQQLYEQQTVNIYYRQYFHVYGNYFRYVTDTDPILYLPSGF